MAPGCAVSSFRSTFAYTNITHVLAGRLVAHVANARDWNAVLQQEILDPLEMKETSYTAAAIESAPNHASGYRWTPDGTKEVPFTQIFPYDFDGAGDSWRYGGGRDLSRLEADARANDAA